MKISKVLLTTLLGSAILASSQLALANTSSIHRSVASYNHVGLQYFDQRLDDYNCRQNGPRLHVSKDIDGRWYGTGAITDVSGNRGCGSTSLAASAGYRIPFNYSFSLYGTLGAEHTAPDTGRSDTGLVASVGFRGMLAHRIEANLELAHHTIYDGNTGVNLGGAYLISRHFAATLDTRFSNHGNSWAVGVRLNF